MSPTSRPARLGPHVGEHRLEKDAARHRQVELAGESWSYVERPDTEEASLDEAELGELGGHYLGRVYVDGEAYTLTLRDDRCVDPYDLCSGVDQRPPAVSRIYRCISLDEIDQGDPRLRVTWERPPKAANDSFAHRWPHRAGPVRGRWRRHPLRLRV